ncbi:FCD domain-containing protein [Bacillus shivajii]|uniref:FCD domain-containing protein n=1 Tax=Bacillus shivajii TaxID=1983719 RepID=UPI001CF98922|nr:FCD domain-containing protein [Bacillus shivajii]UCZ53872.1 FCD domain-containing protein [Bacillus shivajii]
MKKRMNKSVSVQQIDEYHFFSTKGELTEYLLLKKMAESETPLGSWVLKAMLEENGLDVSIATVGRILKALDAKKHSKLIDNQGRILTEKGEHHVTNLTEEVERMMLHNHLMKASKPQDLAELHDLVLARKTIECETARLAAIRAEPHHLDALYQSIHQHEHDVSNKKDPNPIACDFHEKVAEASKNRFLIASLNILIYEEIKLEAKISDLVTRERGEEYGNHHQLIADAIKNKDPELAVKQMNIHMDTLIRAIEEQSIDETFFKGGDS